MADTFTPIAPDRTQCGNKVRIYSGPQWIRPDGKTWVPIEEAVKTVRTATGYQIQYSGKTIDLVAVGKACLAALDTKDTVHAITDREFGPTIKPADMPDAMAWRVDASQGVKKTEDGWEFSEPDGVKLGLFLNDWKNTFADKCTVKDNTITLDMTEAKKAVEAINLDPTIVAASVYYYIGATTTWPACRALATATNVQANGAVVESSIRFMGFWAPYVYRTGLRFDTSAYTTVISAALKLTQAGNMIGTPTPILVTCTLATSLATTSNYATVLAAYPANSVGALTGGTISGSVWTSPSLVPVWSAETTFDLGLLSGRDALNVPPTNGVIDSVAWTGSGANAPYLELVAYQPLITITPFASTTLAITPSAATTLAITPSVSTTLAITPSAGA